MRLRPRCNAATAFHIPWFLLGRNLRRLGPQTRWARELRYQRQRRCPLIVAPAWRARMVTR